MAKKARKAKATEEKEMIHTPITRPISIGGLAERLGVPRQRIYNLVKQGVIKTKPADGGQIIEPAVASAIIEAAVRIETRKGSRLIFDFV